MVAGTKNLQGRRSRIRGEGPSVNQALQQIEGEQDLHRWVCRLAEASRVGSLLVASMTRSSAAGEQGGGSAAW